MPQSNVHWLLAVLGSPHHCRVTGRPSLGAGHVAYAADDTAKLSKLALVSTAADAVPLRMARDRVCQDAGLEPGAKDPASVQRTRVQKDDERRDRHGAGRWESTRKAGVAA